MSLFDTNRWSENVEFTMPQSMLVLSIENIAIDLSGQVTHATQTDQKSR